jgi:hypothetical protein
MKYIITENKIYSSIELYLKSKDLDKVMPHGNGFDGCYYPIEWYDIDDEGDYEPAPCIFVYHSTRKDYLDYHGLPPVFEEYMPSDFPMVELDWEIYKQMEEIFGKEIINRYSPKFFEGVIGNEVKTVFST